MGAACCVAGKGKTVTNVSPGDNLPRHAHYSPSWSFRWDNRGRVAGEETHSNWARDEGCADNSIGVKFGATVEVSFASEEGSPLDGLRSSHNRQKSTLCDGNSGTLKIQSSDQAIPRNILEIKESDSPSVTYSPPLKLSLSPSVPSLSSKSASPLSSQSHTQYFPPNPTPSTWNYRSPRHPHFRQASDIKIPKSPSFSISEEPSSLQAAPSWGNISTRGSQGGSSDGWSIPTLSDLVPARRQSWSFDSDRFARFSGPHSSSPPSLDLQTCGICTQLLTDRSSLGSGSHKLVYSNELAVVSVLICGHVYHSECLEYMTPEIDKYDPSCPVCTFGEKRAAKMSEKALRVETDAKARKRSRKRVVDSDLSGEVLFDHPNSGGPDGRALKLGSGSTRRAFLRRHFTFGAKTSSQFTDSQSNPRRGFFWARSSRE